MPSNRPIRRWVTARTVVLSVLTMSSEAFFASRLIERRPTTQPSSSRRCRTIKLHMAAGKSSAKVITSDEEFAKVALTDSLVTPCMVFFTAPWCGPCRLSIPVVKEVIKEYAASIRAVEVCTDDFPDIAADAGIVSIPTIQIYYKGQVQDTIVGCVARKVLSSAVGKILENADEGTTNGDTSS